MAHRTIRGAIRYTSKKPERLDQERGREFFTLTQQADGIDVLLAHCEIDDEPNVIRDAYNAKKAKHAHAYHNQQGMQFVPLVVNTYGRAEADFVRLMLVLAARQAEVIIAHHRPDTLLLWEADVADHVEDVTGFVDAKLFALEAHESQFESTMKATDDAQIESFRQRIAVLERENRDKERQIVEAAKKDEGRKNRATVVPTF